MPVRLWPEVRNLKELPPPLLQCSPCDRGNASSVAAAGGREPISDKAATRREELHMTSTRTCIGSIGRAAALASALTAGGGLAWAHPPLVIESQGARAFGGTNLYNPA